MKKLTLALTLMASLIGCAQDDQVFDVSALTLWHQLVFADAMDDLNFRYPLRSSFEIKENANSAAVYGEPDVGKLATTYGYHPAIGEERWIIVFHPETLVMVSSILLWLTPHELCHVIGFEHKNGNPDPGNC